MKHRRRITLRPPRLLPRVADLACCGVDEEHQFRSPDMKHLAAAAAHWAIREDTRALAVACLRRVKRTFDLRPKDHPAHGAWQLAFDAMNSWAPRDAHQAQFCADLAALSLAGDAHRCSRRDERDAEEACLRLVPQTYEDLVERRKHFLEPAEMAALVGEGAVDALVRILQSDAKPRKRAVAARRAPLVRAAHDAVVCVLLAAREAYVDRGHLDEILHWLDTRDATVALQTAALPLTHSDAAGPPPTPPAPPPESDADACAASMARALVLLDCLYAASKARDATWPKPHFDHELGATAQKILERLPDISDAADGPLGPAFHILFDLGLGGHVGSTESEETSKALVDLLDSDRPIEDLGVVDERRATERDNNDDDDAKKADRRPTRTQAHRSPLDVPILVRHAATVALLIFAEGRGGDNAWLADVCTHDGLPKLLDIVRRRAGKG